MHLFKCLDGFWSYAEGNPYHAELRSGRCSNGFFFSKTVLRYENLCKIMAAQLAARYLRTGLRRPELVYGIPNGAKELGDYVADFLKVERGQMLKGEDDKLSFVNLPKPGQTVLFVEDFCTRATAFRQAEALLLFLEPQAEVVPLELLILNRGGLTHVDTDRGRYGFSAMVNHRIDDFEPGADTCPMCRADSKPIKAKATLDNWRLINDYQYKV